MYNILKMIEKPWISLLVTAHLSIYLSIYLWCMGRHHFYDALCLYETQTVLLSFG